MKLSLIEKCVIGGGGGVLPWAASVPSSHDPKTGASWFSLNLLRQVARVLGPRGMMPNPKLGTLVEVAALPTAIRQMKGGRVEYR